MKKIYDFVDKFNLEAITGENTSNQNWKEGVDYWYFLDKPVACAYKGGDKEINAFCEMINLFHPAGNDDSKFTLTFGVKLDENEDIEDVEKYILLNSSVDKDDKLHKQILSMDDLNQDDILKFEKFFLRKVYKEYVLKYEEDTIQNVYDEVKKLEKEYRSEENRTIEDIRACFVDDYILDIWDSEKYNEETDDGWVDFDDFILSFLEQNMIFE